MRLIGSFALSFPVLGGGVGCRFGFSVQIVPWNPVYHITGSKEFERTFQSLYVDLPLWLIAAGVPLESEDSPFQTAALESLLLGIYNSVESRGFRVLFL